MHILRRLLASTVLMVLPAAPLVYPIHPANGQTEQEAEPTTEPPSTPAVVVTPNPSPTPTPPAPLSTPKPTPVATSKPAQNRSKTVTDLKDDKSIFELKQYAEKLCADTFGSGQFEALNAIVAAESGWNIQATNRSSGAYGLGQALPGSKMAPFGSDYRTNGETQLRWLMAYIRARYVTPTAAWLFWQRHHWY